MSLASVNQQSKNTTLKITSKNVIIDSSSSMHILPSDDYAKVMALI
jgi:hypothetical protein